MQKDIHIAEMIEKRVLILDGAMGTAIQQKNLAPEDFYYPGQQPANRPVHRSAESKGVSFKANLVPGCNEVLSLSRPDVIEAIHRDYIEAGADIIETNTFSGNGFALKDYGLADKVYEINSAAVRVARQAIAKSERKVFLAASLGPTGRSASFSPKVDDPAYRESDFDDFVTMYREQLKPLLDGGVDLILIETVFDTLIAKAAVTAAMNEFEERGIEVPIMVSATFSDKSRRTLSGQDLEAFIASLSSYPIFSLGMNCSTGAAEMIPLIRDLAKLSPFKTSAHPNAGFPDLDGHYTQTADELAEWMKPVLEEGLLNIVGGCCGTGPAHIAALAKAAEHAVPRKRPSADPVLRLSGWDALTVPQKHLFITVGERANVAGSKKFARLIKEEKYEDAVLLTRKQVEEGAQIIDVCMDDPLIDAPKAMKRFLRLIAADPVAARVPVMIDSSSWPVIETGLAELQGRGIVNSISLKEGEEEFLRRAKTIYDSGAAVMVMLFDEQGQADTFARKCSVAERSCRLLTETAHIPPESVIVDPNILSIATGIDEHDAYARDFIRAVAWIKHQFPGVKVSGGLSNLSFAFRGNNILRRAMHTLFLELAVEAGLDMAIVNPAMEYSSTGIPDDAKTIIREAILLEKGDGPAARQALIDLAMSGSLEETGVRSSKTGVEEWRKTDVQERLSQALIRGDDSHLAADLEEAGKENAMALIEGPLMGGMSKVGRLFGEGKLFLPQVVRSARIMKKAVDILKPYLLESDARRAELRGTVVMATVKGDVHDIGKNIVSLVLQCNHFKVIDLGVMVPSDKILAAAIEHRADMVGLSGLITPSLSEMGEVCRQFEEKGLDIPIMIGGATTSEAHTATKLAPLYPGRVLYTGDASHAVAVALELASGSAAAFLEKTKKRYRDVGQTMQKKTPQLLSMKQAVAMRYKKARPSAKPAFYGIRVLKDLPLDKIRKRINWKMLALAWQIKPASDEAGRIENDAKALLDDPKTGKIFEEALTAVVGLFRASKVEAEAEIEIEAEVEAETKVKVLHFLRSQTADKNGLALSLADYLSGDDSMGCFVASAGKGIDRLVDEFKAQGDDYRALLTGMLADRLAEALSDYLQNDWLKKYWAVKTIRPAVGYPSAPDHSEKKAIFDLLKAEENCGVALTENYAMKPAASVCGYYFAADDVKYFNLGEISEEQFSDYANRKGKDKEELRKSFAGKINN